MAKLINKFIEIEVKHENINEGNSVNEIKDNAKKLIEEFLLKRFEENCTVRHFRKNVCCARFKKKVSFLC